MSIPLVLLTLCIGQLLMKLLIPKPQDCLFGTEVNTNTHRSIYLKQHRVQACWTFFAGPRVCGMQGLPGTSARTQDQNWTRDLLLLESYAVST